MEGPSVTTTEAASAPALSASDKAAAFEEFLDPEDQDDETQPEEQDGTEEGDDLDLEDEETGEDEDEPEEPAIAAPASLNADEKKAFAAASPEAQQAWAASETRRNQQVQEATTKAAERERHANMAVEQAEAFADQKRAAQLKAFMEPFRPVMPDPQLAQRDPASYIAAKAQYDFDIAQFSDFEQQVEGMQTGAQQRLGEIDAHSRVADLMTVPKLADPASRDDYLKTSLELVQVLGLDPSAFENAASSNDFRALEKVAEWKEGYDKYKKAMSRKMQGVRAAQGKTIRPTGAPHANARTQSGNDWQRVKQARSKESQAEAFADWVGL